MDAATLKDIIREHLSDTVEDYRFSDSEITAEINKAAEKVFGDRPELQLSNSGTLQSASITNVPDLYEDAVVSWALHRLFLKDGEDTHHQQLASIHASAYKENIG